MYYWWLAQNQSPVEQGPQAVSISVSNRDVQVGDESINFSAYPLTVLYDDNTTQVVEFDITAQVAPYLDGGVAPVTVTLDGATASFEVYFYDMKIDELILEVWNLQENPPTDMSAFSNLCSNKHILLTDYTALTALSIDRFDSVYGIANVFGNTYIRRQAKGPNVILTAITNEFPIEISAFNITVEDASFVATDIESTRRLGACAIYGNDITIRNTTLNNGLTPATGTNVERTGISIQKGNTNACGTTTEPGYPERVLIEDTTISGFDVSVNISTYNTTLRNVTFDSPIVIAVVDPARLDEIIIEEPHSEVAEGNDVIIIAQNDEQKTDENVLAFVERLESLGLTVSVEAIEVEVGGVTISPWQPGGSASGEATMG